MASILLPRLKNLICKLSFFVSTILTQLIIYFLSQKKVKKFLKLILCRALCVRVFLRNAKKSIDLYKNIFIPSSETYAYPLNLLPPRKKRKKLPTLPLTFNTGYRFHFFFFFSIDWFQPTNQPTNQPTLRSGRNRK